MELWNSFQTSFTSRFLMLTFQNFPRAVFQLPPVSILEKRKFKMRTKSGKREKESFSPVYCDSFTLPMAAFTSFLSLITLSLFSISLSLYLTLPLSLSLSRSLFPFLILNLPISLPISFSLSLPLCLCFSLFSHSLVFSNSLWLFSLLSPSML